MFPEQLNADTAFALTHGFGFVSGFLYKQQNPFRCFSEDWGSDFLGIHCSANV